MHTKAVNVIEFSSESDRTTGRDNPGLKQVARSQILVVDDPPAWIARRILWAAGQ
jgi:hypothetical protein